MIPCFGVGEAVHGSAVLNLGFGKLFAIEIELAEGVARLRAERINVHGAAEFGFGKSVIPLSGVDSTEMDVRGGIVRPQLDSFVKIRHGVFVAPLLDECESKIRQGH